MRFRLYRQGGLKRQNHQVFHILNGTKRNMLIWLAWAIIQSLHYGHSFIQYNRNMDVASEVNLRFRFTVWHSAQSPSPLIHIICTCFDIFSTSTARVWLTPRSTAHWWRAKELWNHEPSNTRSIPCFCVILVVGSSRLEMSFSSEIKND